MNFPAVLIGWVFMGCTSLIGGGLFPHTPFSVKVGVIIASFIVGTALGAVITRAS